MLHLSSFLVFLSFGINYQFILFFLAFIDCEFIGKMSSSRVKSNSFTLPNNFSKQSNCLSLKLVGKLL